MLLTAPGPKVRSFIRPLLQRNSKSITEAVDEAKQNDINIAVLGEDVARVGEGLSRTGLDLPGRTGTIT